MSRNAKRWLIAAASLVALGLALFVVVLCANGWDFSQLSTIQFETKTHTVSGDFSNISLHVHTEDIHLVPSEDGKCTVVCAAPKTTRYDVAIANGTLSIVSVDEREWYEHISFSIQTPKITVYLPQNAYGALTIDSDTGDITLPEPFAFERVKASTNTGDIKSSASVSGSVELRTDTGDITISNIECNEHMNFHSSTGDVKVSNVTCKSLRAEGDTGDVFLNHVIASETLSAETDTGDIKLEACDAAELFLEADTGDIRGTLLSEKVFFAESDTGDIDVPKTMTGGRCEARTDTGDINISIIK